MSQGAKTQGTAEEEGKEEKVDDVEQEKQREKRIAVDVEGVQPLHLRVYVCVCVCVCVCMYVCMYVCVHTYACVHVCMYVNMYMYE